MKKKIADDRTTFLFVAACWFAYSCSYIGRLNFSASMAEMTSLGVLLKSEAGSVTTGFFICYGLGQFLSGWLGDKTEPRHLVFIGLALSSAINVGISFAPPLWLMVLLWSANGIAQALLWAPIVKIISDRVSLGKRQKACTAMATTMAAGTLLAYFLSAVLISLFGWTASFRCGAAATSIAAVVWLLIVGRIEKKTDKDGIEEIRPEAQEEDEPSGSVPHDEIPSNLIKMMLVSGLATLAFCGAAQGVLKDCMSTWVPTFIADMFGTGSVVSILTGTLLPIFGLFGPYLANFFVRKTGDELSSVFVLFLISSGALALLSLFGKFSIVLSIIVLALTYSCSLGQNMLIIGTIPMYFSNVGRVSTVTGTLNAVSYISTAAVSWLTGIFVDSAGWGIVMTGWFAMSVLAAVAVIFAKRRWNKFRRNLF